MKIKITFLFILSYLLLIPSGSFCQHLQAGFDKAEYRQLMYLSARTGSLDSAYLRDIPAPDHFKKIYRSPVMGLDNLWELWAGKDATIAISIRGTTTKLVSWTSNFYAAMVPASGEIALSTNDTFKYALAANPKASVHIGWLIGMAYLSKDILPKIDSCYRAGVRDILIIGHSQGGAISFLITSYLHSLIKQKKIPDDIRIKTYCSAGPKPGNLYYAYEYEALTQHGWAFNVVNSADWVPETPMSIQTLHDFNTTNPFVNAKPMIRKQPFLKRVAFMHAFNRLDKPTRKAQRTYEKYLGKIVSRQVNKTLKDFVPPTYANSNHYVRTGTTVVLTPDTGYYAIYPDGGKNIFIHHLHKPYLYLLEKYAQASPK